jgi:hypothetical protein
LIYHDGDTYEGEFKNGKPNGRGTLIKIDGSTFEGEWKDGQLFKRFPPLEERAFSRVIPSHVRREVWRRDQGKCVNCGSRKNLEYDHIIPFSEGGSNTARNIELLCEECNRKKSNNIG